MKYIWVVAVAAVLFATLWPFSVSPRNGVSWLQETRGLKFEKPGLVVGSANLTPAETNQASYTIELLLRPEQTKSSSTIMAVYVPDSPGEFTVRQWKDGLIVTHNANVDYDNSSKALNFGVPHVFHAGSLVLLTISSGPDGTTVYVNGQPAKTVADFRISRSELSGELVLGTSPAAYRPWSGELHGLAIYSKSLGPDDAWQHYKQWMDPSRLPDLGDAMVRYAFTEPTGNTVPDEVASAPALKIPATFSVPYKGFLRSPRREFKPDRDYVIDVLGNIAGFVPLGFVVCGYFGRTRERWTAILVTTICCGILSLTIEVLQYFIPRRGSGITDVITNSLGAAVGAALMQADALRPLRMRVSARFNGWRRQRVLNHSRLEDA